MRVGAGHLNLEIDFVDHALVRRHGLDHIGGLSLPVVADIAHAQIDFVLVRRSGVECMSQQAKGYGSYRGRFQGAGPGFHRFSSHIPRAFVIQVSRDQVHGPTRRARKRHVWAKPILI